MKTVYLIMGQSGSGKDTIANLLRQYDLKVLCSYTTRPQRYKDEDTHIFISSDDVKNYAQSMIAYTNFDGHEYFATIDQLLESDIYIIDPDGIDYLKEKIESVNFVTLYIYVSLEDRIKRMHSRGDAPEKIFQRLVNDEKKFRNLDFDYAVKNTTLEKSVEAINKLIRHENEYNK